MKGHKNKHTIFHKALIFTMASLTLLFTGGAFLPELIHSASAVSETSKSARTKINATIDSVISITAPPSGNLTESGTGDAPITPTPNGTTATYSEDVVVSTNNLTGYKLAMSMAPGADNNKLNSVLDPNISISSITSATPLSSLPANTWGYNVPSLTEHSNNYQALPDPTASTPEERQHTIRPDGQMGTETTTVNFATKVDTSQPAGSYNNTVLYTATASDPAPTGTAKAILGENKNLNFVYDNNEYTEGQTYTDNLGETTISKIYDVPYNTQVIEECDEWGDCYVTDIENAPGWIGDYIDYSDPREDITSANFSSNFHNYPVASTAGWFIEDEYLSSITNIANLNTSEVADISMSHMFDGTGFSIEEFNIDLSNLDTHNVTDMSNMFSDAGSDATTWSLDLSGWNTSNVTDMSGMFQEAGYSATTFSLDLSNWDTAKVTDMSSMFSYAGFDAATWSIGGLSNWDTSNVTNMSGMFSDAGYYATTWSLGGLSNWDTSNVTDMSSMFSDAGQNATTWSIGDLSGWNTSNVTNMSGMFSWAGSDATTWSIGDLSGWNTSNVTNMSGMFFYAGSYATTWSIGDLSGWNTSNVTNMSGMFYYVGRNATAPVTIDLSGWNTSSVTNMSSMFSRAGSSATTFSLDLSNWDTSSVTNMGGMFSSAGGNATTFSLDLSNWNTSSVTNMDYMFRSAGENATAPVTIDLSGWNTSNVTDMSYMFYSAGLNATAPIHVYVGDGWQIGTRTATYDMFYDAKGLVGQQETAWASGKPTGGTYARVDKAKETPSVPGYFWDHNYTPPNPPVNPENNTNNFTNINNTYNTTNNSTNTTGTTEQGNSTDSYSNPQGVSSSKNTIPGTSGPNWFLFILLLTLSILTLGVSLFLFYKKRKQQKEQQEYDS